MRSSGILCAISSLPSKYGIGDLGYSSYKFIDKIKKAGLKYWQILPLNPTDIVNSPYASSCDGAIDPIYVSLELLREDGLIKHIPKAEFNKNKVEYKKVRLYKEALLRKAYKKQNDLDSKQFLEFFKENPWLKDFALFLVLSKKYNGALPYTWKKRDREAFYKDVKISIKNQKEINYIYWVQYILYTQLQLLKNKLKEADITLIGDMPFYVGNNSSDFIANIDNFVVKENDEPKSVAGVPPDYFAPEGQLWGNPIYDFDFMKDDHYSFFLTRIKNALKKYDLLRLDHFRAFDTYYEVPFGNKNAVNGVWKQGLGAEFISVLKDEGLLERIIVEDLGEMFPSVYKLRDQFNLSGMNVIQFTMFDKKFKYIENQVIYTGTHDNDTIIGFYNKMKPEEKELLKIKFRYENIDSKLPINYKFIEFAFKSDAYLAIVPIQDFLGLDNKSRMNRPGIGKEGLNWTFRLENYKVFDKISPRILKLVEKYNR